MRRQQQRSAATRASILQAAADLFGSKGYEAVTMRDIARQAECSHTTIYLYFADKEALLIEMALPRLLDLQQTLSDLLEAPASSLQERLQNMGSAYIEFGLQHRTVYETLFLTLPQRVDAEIPTNRLNEARIELFRLFQRAVPGGELDVTRILFYSLHGVVTSYLTNREPTEELLARILPLKDRSLRLMLAGLEVEQTTKNL